MKSLALPSFWKLYRRVPEAIRQEARAAYRQFIANPLHPGLHFHRLFNDPLCWSASITRDYRAVGLLQGDTITWIWIGDHAAFDKAFRR